MYPEPTQGNRYRMVSGILKYLEIMAGKTTLKETMKWEKVSTDCSEAVDGVCWSRAHHGQQPPWISKDTETEDTF